MTGRKAHLYLDAETDELLSQMAERDRGRRGIGSRSEVARRAIRELAAREKVAPNLVRDSKRRSKRENPGVASD